MKRTATVLTLLLVLLSTGLRADVTVTNTLTITGPVAAMMGGANPQMVMRIKGSRARMDIDVMGQKVSNIMDLDAKQITMLMHAQKTAQVMDAAQLASRMPSGAAMPNVDAKVEPTGRTQEIGGQLCSEYRYSMSLDMANVAGRFGQGAAAAGGATPGTVSPQPSGQLPPGAAEMFKDIKVVMNGSMWVAKEGPGIAEYSQFAKAAQQNMLSLSPFGAMPGAAGMEDLMRSFSQLDGLTYLAEIEMTFEGTNPMLEMLKSMGTMKLTTKVTEVSTQPVPDDLFQIPPDYTVPKQ